MKLLYQTHSPYARKALVFAHEAGLAEQIEVSHHETSPLRRTAEVFAANPLGKVPVLLRPGLPALFDSDVICAYLDTLHPGRKLIPTEGEARNTWVLTKEGGTWQVASFQNTPVAPPESRQVGQSPAE